ncbi:hypothetical protein FACS189413_17360 [Bacteroidia bacterium]|nr:hypothetical protein FACS189463_3040 [Bacteroidia bacterium]GHU73225.1 hypothetical protein FACS189413_17360 [Bacteroidia bacterium]
MKKNLFKKAGTSLLLGGMLFGAMPMNSQSLYVYTASSPTSESFLLDDVQELTFSGSNLVVNKKTGDPVTFTTLKFFSLRNFDSSSGIAPNTAEAAISVYPNPAVADVIVHSTTTITGLGLYNLQGQKLLQLYPESLEATVPLASYPSGLYMLQVADESGITIKKIIKN